MPKVENCDNCAACCMGQNLLPLSGAVLYKMKLPPKLEKPLRAILEGPCKGDDGCACVWLDRATGRCKHHKFRPMICRDFKVGSDDCLRIRAGAGLDAPGERDAYAD